MPEFSWYKHPWSYSNISKSWIDFKWLSDANKRVTTKSSEFQTAILLHPITVVHLPFRAIARWIAPSHVTIPAMCWEWLYTVLYAHCSSNKCMLPFGLSKPVLDIDVVSRYLAFSRTPPLLLAVLRMLPPSICAVRYLLSTVPTWQTLGLIVAMSFVLFQSPSSACYPTMTYPTTLLLGTRLHTTTLGSI